MPTPAAFPTMKISRAKLSAAFAAILIALAVAGVASAQSTPATDPGVSDCNPKILVKDGDVIFKMPNLSEYSGELRGHYVYVWVEDENGDLGPLRNEINGPQFGIVRVQFQTEEADRWFHYRVGSYARTTLLDYVSPTTGVWFSDYRFPFRCTSEGQLRVPLAHDPDSTR